MPSRHPAPQVLADGVWLVPGSAGPETTSACVLIADGQDTTLVDPGRRTADNRRRLRAALAGLGRAWDCVTTVIITHSHSDHAGIADDLRSELAGEVGASTLVSGVAYGGMEPDRMAPSTASSRLTT